MRLQNLVRRVVTRRTVYLALMELRLEATRRPSRIGCRGYRRGEQIPR